MSTQKSNQEQEALPSEMIPDNAQPLRGRRHFMGASAAASTILTIASQPALGTTCFTPSRSLSRNTSLSQQGQFGECNGISPGNYMAQTNPLRPSYNWPQSVQPSTLFHSIFSKGSALGTIFVKKVNSKYVSMSMLEVLGLQGNGDPNKVAFHIIGAYLNAVNHYLDPKITTASIVAIWNSYASLGYYPVLDQKWSGADIVNYLKSNGIAP